jgi:hypothetical protein
MIVVFLIEYLNALGSIERFFTLDSNLPPPKVDVDDDVINEN